MIVGMRYGVVSTSGRGKLAVGLMCIMMPLVWAQSPCSNFIELIPRVEQVDEVCCVEPGACTALTTTMALPATDAQCRNEICADAFIPFWDDCQEMARTMGFDAQGHDDFYTSCLETVRGSCGVGCTDLSLPCRMNEVSAACCSPPPPIEEIDNCGVNGPCLNGGMCFTRLLSPTGYECDCADGWSGQTCEVAIDICTDEENDCDIHASCEHTGPAEHSCTCKLGYESTAGHPECDPVFLGPDLGFVNILQYNDADGTCELSMMELQAVCSGAMFQTCLDFVESEGAPSASASIGCTEIDECASSPCQNGGVCTDEFLGYSCACHGLWLGHNCEIAPPAEYCAPGHFVPDRCSIDCAAVMNTFAAECTGPLERLDPDLQLTVASFDETQCQTIGIEQFLDRIDILQLDKGCELSLAWQVYSATDARVTTVGVNPPETWPPVVNATHIGGIINGGYVEFEGPPSNQWVAFEVQIPEGGEYAIQFGYEPAAEDRPMQLTINGAVVGAAAQSGFDFDGLIHFPPANSGQTYMLTGQVPVVMHMGTNSILVTTTIFGGVSINGLYFASGPQLSMAGNVAIGQTGGGGHRRQQVSTLQPNFRPGSGNFLLGFAQDTSECPWDTVDQRVAGVSDACCTADQPNMQCTDSLPDVCTWQCAVQVHAFLVKCPEFASISGSTYSHPGVDFGEQLMLLHESCLAAVDVGVMQETANAAQCSP